MRSAKRAASDRWEQARQRILYARDEGSLTEGEAQQELQRLDRLRQRSADRPHGREAHATAGASRR